MADSIRKFAKSKDKRDELFLKFKEREAEKDRQHELAMAKMFATAFAQSREVPNAPLPASSQRRDMVLQHGHFSAPQQQPFPPGTHVTANPAEYRRYSNVAGRLYENLGGENNSPELF